MISCECESCGEAFDAAPVGGHRVLCGDSADLVALALLMDGASADLCFTSPPYGQQRDYKASIADWDALMRGVFAALPMRPGGQVLVNLGLIHRDGEWVPYWDGWVGWMRKQGWRRFGWYVWDQGPGLPGGWNGRLAPSHEWIFHFNKQAGDPARKSVASKYGGTMIDGYGLRTKDGSIPNRQSVGDRLQARKSKVATSAGDVHDAGGRHGLRGKDGTVSRFSHAGRAVQPRKIPDSIVRVLRLLGDYEEALAALSDEDVEGWPDDVVRVMRHKGHIGKGLKHPAPFPVALPVEIIRAYSEPGDVVFEPFCGAGSTVIACEQHDRRCYGAEIAPTYCDVIVRRWQQFTGGVAVLADGTSFADREAA